MKNRGFSLLELMIVVGIMMVLAGGGLWSLKNRIYKNEVIKMKTAIPTLLNTGSLRVYEKGIKDATLTATGSSVSISNIGSGMEVKSSIFTFSTSPSALGTLGSISELGVVGGDFDIIVKDKTGTTVMTFTVRTKGNWAQRIDVVVP